MDLPFPQSEFLAVFARYNDAVWPLQLVFMAAAAVSAAGVWRGRRSWSRATFVLLGGLWLWMGVVYHGIYFRPINPAAAVFALLFVVQGVILLTVGLKTAVVLQPARSGRGFAGGALILFALIVYPAIGYAVGHRYPYSPTFGLPCPTTLFTLGVLLWSRPLRTSLFVIPLIWTAIGFLAAVRLGIHEDASLLVGGLLVGVLLIRARRRRAHPVGAAAAR